MSEHGSPPRENLIRAVGPTVAWRDEEGEDTRPLLFGHFNRSNQWTEIDSVFEGRFMERFAPGAFKKTLREQRDKIRVLFQHGRDPMIGDKPIAQIEELREDEEGAYHESRLLDGVPELIVAGLRAGQYGQSFRFSVIKEDFNERPDRSDLNPKGIGERTVLEARLEGEFGPVTFPAYANTTPGMRSMTDRFIFDWLERHPTEARSLIGAHDLAFREKPKAALPAEEAAESTSAPASRDTGHSALFRTTERRSALDV